MLQLSSGISYMHKNRIMHRDLKPANILLDGAGNLKIADLGLGRNFGTGTLEVFSKVGTPLYMSPELLRGRGYGMKSDIWSIGCILYELCELSSPFRKDKEKISLKDLFDRITTGKVRKLASKRYSQKLKNTIYSMISMDADKRVDGETVAMVATAELSRLKNIIKIDKSFVMEDIFYKLNLLDSRKHFSRPLGLQPLDPIFFVNEEEDYYSSDKFEYFYLLSTWLLAILATPGCELMLATESESSLTQSEQLNKIYEKLQNCGIKFSIHFSKDSLKLGYGDEVCYLINEMTTKILIKRNYSFQMPEFLMIENNSVALDQELEEDKLEDGIEEDLCMSNSYQKKNCGSTSSSLRRKLGIFVVKIDPKEWKKECKELSSELLAIGERLNEGDLCEEGYSLQLHGANKCIKDLKAFLRISPFVEGISTSIHKDLSKINSKQLEWQKELRQLPIISSDTKSMSYNLDLKVFKLSMSNKEKIKQYKGLKSKLAEIHVALGASKNWNSKVSRRLQIVKAIGEIKGEIKWMSVRIEIMRAILFKRDKTVKVNMMESIMLGHSKLECSMVGLLPRTLAILEESGEEDSLILEEL